MGALTSRQRAACWMMSCSLHTNCEVRKSQKPEVSANKICIWPVSRMRIPTHTSASHILLYSSCLSCDGTVMTMMMMMYSFARCSSLNICCYAGVLSGLPTASRWLPASDTERPLNGRSRIVGYVSTTNKGNSNERHPRPLYTPQILPPHSSICTAILAVGCRSCARLRQGSTVDLALHS